MFDKSIRLCIRKSLFSLEKLEVYSVVCIDSLFILNLRRKKLLDSLELWTDMQAGNRSTCFLCEVDENFCIFSIYVKVM